MSTPIEEYAFSPTPKQGHLVCTTGSIDWLGLPRFDSPSCFACVTWWRRAWLLEDLRPADDHWTSTRQYLGET